MSKKISDLPIATSAADQDRIEIEQAGESKQLQAGLLFNAIGINDGTLGVLSGVTPITSGQNYVDVVFSSQQPNALWAMLDKSVINTIDGSPLNISPLTITSKSSTGFRLQLSGLPDSSNYYLSWSIRGVFGYTLNGPVSGNVGVPSGNFTVAKANSVVISGTAVITPSDGGSGGTFTPASVSISNASPSATFTYTPISSSLVPIGTTNNGTLIDPQDLGYLVFADHYTLSGPSSGHTADPSTNFTVALPVGGMLASSVTITPSDSGGGGAFAPTTVTLSSTSPSATFVYTPATAGAKTIAVTNSGSLTNPSSIVYTAFGLLDGASISTWADSSLNSHDATQSGSARPIYRRNIVNGKPVVRLTSAGLSSMVIANPISGVGPFTVIAVTKPVTNFGLTALASSGAAFPTLLTTSGGGPGLYVGDRVNYVQNSGAYTYAWHVLSGTINGSGGSGSVYMDGTSLSTAGGATGGTGNFDVIGLWSGSSYSDGDIAEILYFNAQLSGTDRANIEKYLGAKYGITVASGTAVDPSTIASLRGWWKADSL